MVGADVAWMIVATALVLLMTPALAFFYGGLVRSKNALNTMMMSFISLGVLGVTWAVVGYSLAFGEVATGSATCRSCCSRTSASERRRRHRAGRSRTSCSWRFRRRSRSSLPP